MKTYNDINSMEITYLNNVLYQQQQLKIYAYCSHANNFNLMKHIWEWIDMIYKLIQNIK